MPGTEPRRTTYMDHAATTPLRPEAREAMLPWLGDRFGNPSGAHRVARDARRAIDEARDNVAEIVGCEPNDVVFTSGGTEADNMAVRGVLSARPGALLTSAVEHHAVLNVAESLGARLLPVDRWGRVDLDHLDQVLRPEEGRSAISLVSVMTANNEVGVVQPLPDIVRLVRKHAPEAVVHTDAVQAAAWLDLRELAEGADLISLSGHKVGGPQGTGVLVVRRGTRVTPLLLGGGQERELRSGTHNVAGIVGMAAALRAAAAERPVKCPQVAARRDRLADGLLAAIDGAWETGAPDGDRSHLLPGTLHLVLPGAESEALLFLLDEAGVCASAASACASGAQQASHVLGAMGVTTPLGSGVLRLTLGWTSTNEDVDRVLEVLPGAVERLRSRSGVRGGVR